MGRGQVFSTVSDADVGTNSVMTGAVAQVGPIRLPFRGINQTPACDKITEVETGLTVGCNLQAGKTYTYSFDLPILGRYPTVYKYLINFTGKRVDRQFMLPGQRPGSVGAAGRCS